MDTAMWQMLKEAMPYILAIFLLIGMGVSFWENGGREFLIARMRRSLIGWVLPVWPVVLTALLAMRYILTGTLTIEYLGVALFSSLFCVFVIDGAIAITYSEVIRKRTRPVPAPQPAPDPLPRAAPSPSPRLDPAPEPIPQPSPSSALSQYEIGALLAMRKLCTTGTAMSEEDVKQEALLIQDIWQVKQHRESNHTRAR